jgi:thymidylate synthase ThyX
MTGKQVQKWADSAMFASEKLDATQGPTVRLLSMNADPLGEIASAAMMYEGTVVRDLSEVTDDQRRHYFREIGKTKLKAAYEFVNLHFLIEGVTRSFTHQMVRQRTAVYAQESLRFAVVEDEFVDRVSLPPSLAATTGEWHDFHTGMLRAMADLTDYDTRMSIDAVGEEYEVAIDRLPEAEKQRMHWDQALNAVENAYTKLVNSGVPAEDARGLLPHNITTRLHYKTDLRNLLSVSGDRLCTQAQFEWRLVFAKMVEAIRTYKAEYTNTDGNKDDSFWQFDEVAKIFAPACYQTGRCEFRADFDRKCTIRERVDANAAAGRPSAFWRAHGNGNLLPIFPAEWLLDSGAAR